MSFAALVPAWNWRYPETKLVADATTAADGSGAVLAGRVGGEVVVASG
ncbi:MAG TPA: hypothetical protein VHZ75_11310 [Solirubrobacteraceae bacterium]|jgi:hypothetical protein|nr:hypothetical protein [Solirubrobacteraceae bacterium]